MGFACVITSSGCYLSKTFHFVKYRFSYKFFSTDDVSVASASMTDRSTPSPAHVLRQEQQTSADGHQIYTEDYYLAPDKDNEYIYVTYPPDLKRRLLERFVPAFFIY